MHPVLRIYTKLTELNIPSHNLVNGNSCVHQPKWFFNWGRFYKNATTHIDHTTSVPFACLSQPPCWIFCPQRFDHCFSPKGLVNRPSLNSISSHTVSELWWDSQPRLSWARVSQRDLNTFSLTLGGPHEFSSQNSGLPYDKEKWDTNGFYQCSQVVSCMNNVLR